MKIFDDSFSEVDINNMNVDTHLNFKNLNLQKEMNLSEIIEKLKILVIENQIWYKDNFLLKECLVGLRKITCSYLRQEIKNLIDNKIHSILFEILNNYQKYNEYSEGDISILVSDYIFIK